MRLHANARTCPISRRLLVRRVEAEGWSLTRAAEAAGVSERRARKWRARWRAEGEQGLLDRSSAPKRIPDKTSASTVAVVEALRRLRMAASEIAEVLELGSRRFRCGCGGLAWASARGWGHRSHPIATSAPAPASSSTSTSRSSGVSALPANA